MTLSDKTKMGLTVGQITAWTIAVFTFATWHAAIQIQLKNLEYRMEQSEKKQTECQQATESQNKINRDFVESFHTIKESLIRIEGKLETKQDRYTR